MEQLSLPRHRYDDSRMGVTPLEELVLRLYNILLLDFFEDIDQSTSIFAVSRRLLNQRPIIIC